ncbi:hypothetical protein P2H44_06590 [Albimonas sp. CAU 1670]|uniref:hypothetical protein n=1 Tax=Albimonas sp. CAU 1670 TaxID=3032599 RepID=UPI0023DC909B|nr:hypothetical protein [Albimonas sp. CAU 1670]MDF2232218.1 hypothetical protein [Albimonas sp. CAU 1670]
MKAGAALRPVRALAAALAAGLCLAVSGAGPAAADWLAMTLAERAETAETIVTGEMVALRSLAPDARGLVPQEGLIRVERVLKGEAEAGETLAVALPPRGPGGIRTSADFEPELNRPTLWLLRAGRDGRPTLDRPDRALPLDELPPEAEALGLAP